MTTAVTQAETTEKSRQGAPLGNQNATKHGLSARHGLRGSSLPKGCGHIRRAINVFRRALEAAVFEDRGEVSITDAALINSAYRWEKHSQLCQRWLFLESEKLSDADRLSYSRDVARASCERDKAIAQLKLPQSHSTDPWQIVDAPPEKPHDATTEPVASDTVQQSTDGQASTTSPTEPQEA